MNIKRTSILVIMSLSLIGLSACKNDGVKDFRDDELVELREDDLNTNQFEAVVNENNGQLINFTIVNVKDLERDLNGKINVGNTFTIDHVNRKEARKIKEGDHILVTVNENIREIDEDPIRLDGAEIVSVSKEERFSQFQKGES